MPRMTRTRRIAITAGFVLVLGALALLPLIAEPNNPRNVVLVARRMAFYLGSDPTSPNPVIKVAPGEWIRITLVNLDPGFDHNFAVDAWRVMTSPLHGKNRTSVVVQAPDTPGTVAYVCTMHPEMMRGTIEVTPSR